MLKIIKQNSISLIIMIILVGGCLFFGLNNSQDKVYDCSMSEFHPDYPIKVKEACRDLNRSNKLNQ